MRRRIWILLFLSAALWAQPAAAQGLGGFLSNLGQVLTTLTGSPAQGVIVRTTLGSAGLQSACQQKGCTVVSIWMAGKTKCSSFGQLTMAFCQISWPRFYAS